MIFPIEQLRNWFFEHRRSLPWRENPTPYRVWISEVMLQQTQAVTVIPYFEKWMEVFPTIETLAAAPLSDVIKLWEGLGYYSRARALHEGAKWVVEHGGGVFPASSEQIEQIKGIGPYTRGAILNFAFHQKAAALDGNVIRVLSRFFAFDLPVDQEKNRRHLEKKLLSLLPEDEPWVISEGLIELGALVCQRKASCLKCPLKKECLGFRQGVQNELPKKRARFKSEKLYRTVAVIAAQGAFLLKKGKPGEVMGELYEFPYLEEVFPKSALVVKAFERELGMKLELAQELKREKHTFTKYIAYLEPFLMQASSRSEMGPGFIWSDRPESLPLSSGHRRLLQQVVSL